MAAWYASDASGERVSVGAARFYRAIESAKLGGIEPKAYLRAATQAALQGDPIPLPHTLATPAPRRPQ